MKQTRKHFLLYLLVLVMFCFAACAPTELPESTPTETTLQAPAVFEGTEKQEITVVSFNVRREYSTDLGVRSWAERKEPMIQYLNELSPDIFCMQEISHNILKDITGGLSHSYDYEYFNNNLVLYRRDILKPEVKGAFYLNSDPLKAQRGWDAKNVRNCQYLLFRHLDSGAKFYLFNTHFDAHGATARQESALLLDRLFRQCEYPFLLCGDLNAPESYAAYHTLMQSMIDCRKVAPQTDDGATYQGWGAVADGTGTPIDYCLASTSGVEPLRFQILRDRWGLINFYSDHYAIRCTVNILY